MREIVLGEVEWDGRDEYGDKLGRAFTYIGLQWFRLTAKRKKN